MCYCVCSDTVMDETLAQLISFNVYTAPASTFNVSITQESLQNLEGMLRDYYMRNEINKEPLFISTPNFPTKWGHLTIQDTTVSGLEGFHCKPFQAPLTKLHELRMSQLHLVHKLKVNDSSIAPAHIKHL